MFQYHVVQPSVMGAVPLMLESVYKGIKEGVSRKGHFFVGLLLHCCRLEHKIVVALLLTVGDLDTAYTGPEKDTTLRS